MGIYTDGKPNRFRLLTLIFEAIKKAFKQEKEEKEWEQKLKDGYGKGLKNSDNEQN